MIEEDCISNGREWMGPETVCLGDNNDNGIDDACEGLQEIPTLSEWGMLLMALLLLAVGTIAIVRRKKEAYSKVV